MTSLSSLKASRVGSHSEWTCPRTEWHARSEWDASRTLSVGFGEVVYCLATSAESPASASCWSSGVNPTFSSFKFSFHHHRKSPPSTRKIHRTQQTRQVDAVHSGLDIPPLSVIKDQDQELLPQRCFTRRLERPRFRGHANLLSIVPKMKLIITHPHCQQTPP